MQKKIDRRTRSTRRLLLSDLPPCPRLRPTTSAPVSHAIDHVSALFPRLPKTALDPFRYIVSYRFGSDIFKDVSAHAGSHDPIYQSQRPEISLSVTEDVGVCSTGDATEDEVGWDGGVAGVGERFFEGNKKEEEEIG